MKVHDMDQNSPGARICSIGEDHLESAFATENTNLDFTKAIRLEEIFSIHLACHAAGLFKDSFHAFPGAELPITRQIG